MVPKIDVADERRAQIIEAALTCFARRGYRNTTMDDIAAESGLSKGSLYWYFNSKDDLFASAITSVFMDIGQQTTTTLDQYTTASDKLRAVAQEAVKFCKATEGFFSLFVEFWVQSSRREEAAQLWTDLLVQFKDIMAGIIEEGIRSGEFRSVDSEQLVWAMMATYDGLAVYAMMMPDIDVDRVSRAFIETLLNGLIADGRGGRRVFSYPGGDEADRAIEARLEPGQAE